MSKRNPHRGTPEETYWESHTDLMSALALVLILIIVLLALYLLQIPEFTNRYNDDRGGYAWETEHEEQEHDDHDEDEDEDHDEEAHQSDNGGGSGGDDEDEFDEEYPIPSSGSDGDTWGKSAVYATVVDAETGRAIKKSGLTFELYERQALTSTQKDGAIRFLNTYYPKKTEYRNYKTTKEGVFYLPEKIEEGMYYFKQISDLEGYDPAERVDFTVDDVYDWPEPYVVSIPISPAKNHFEVELIDSETKQPLTDGSFTVKAAEDIVTADETVRLQKKELADEVVIAEETKVGESKDLYLGNYIVAQEQSPLYYTVSTEPQKVEIKQKGTTEIPKLVFEATKTQITVHVADELYPDKGIEGAQITLICKGDKSLSQSGVTDKSGDIVFTNLEKNASYSLEQTGSTKGYKWGTIDDKWHVDKSGYIDGEASAELTITNYLPRTAISISDQLLGNAVSDVSVTLYQNDAVVNTWTSNGSEKILDNLPSGQYEVAVNGKRYPLTADDTQPLVSLKITVFTMQDIVVVAVAVSGIVAVLAITLLIWRKKKGKKRE